MAPELFFLGTALLIAWGLIAWVHRRMRRQQERDELFERRADDLQRFVSSLDRLATPREVQLFLCDLGELLVEARKWKRPRLHASLLRIGVTFYRKQQVFRLIDERA